jgi:hypothetical protein
MARFPGEAVMIAAPMRNATQLTIKQSFRPIRVVRGAAKMAPKKLKE